MVPKGSVSHKESEGRVLTEPRALSLTLLPLSCLHHARPDHGNGHQKVCSVATQVLVTTAQPAEGKEVL